MTATQPSAKYTGVYSQRGAPTHNTRNSTPASAPSQTISSSVRALPGSSSSAANGVYEPAMIRKMFEWSRRFSTPWTRGDQVPRWYTALVPNSSAAVSVKTLALTRPALVGATQISTMPAATARGNVPACSHPRSRGLTAATASLTASPTASVIPPAVSSSDVPRPGMGAVSMVTPLTYAAVGCRSPAGACSSGADPANGAVVAGRPGAPGVA